MIKTLTEISIESTKEKNTDYDKDLKSLITPDGKAIQLSPEGCTKEVIINDSVTSQTTTWSSEKIRDDYPDNSETASMIADAIDDYNDTISPDLVSDNAQTWNGQKTFTDGLVSNSGATINGELHVNGDIIQSGDTYVTEVETLKVEDELIVTRNGASVGMGAGEYTGIKAECYDGTNNGLLAFDKDGIAHVGDEGDLQPLCTREDTPSDGVVQVWDDTNKCLKSLSGTNGQVLQTNASGEAEWVNSAVNPDANLSKSSTKAIQNKAVAANLSCLTCSTSETTAAKTVTCNGFTLYDGASVKVLFTKASYAASATTQTLNVNGTGAKPIYVNQHGTPVALKAYRLTADSTYLAHYWQAYSVMELVYVSSLDCWLIMNADDVCMSSASSTESYSIKWNGLIRQRGYQSNPSSLSSGSSWSLTITFPVKYSAANYQFFFTPCCNYNNISSSVWTGRTETTIPIMIYNNSSYTWAYSAIDWQSEGY